MYPSMLKSADHGRVDMMMLSWLTFEAFVSSRHIGDVAGKPQPAIVTSYDRLIKSLATINQVFVSCCSLSESDALTIYRTQPSLLPCIAMCSSEYGKSLSRPKLT